MLKGECEASIGPLLEAAAVGRPRAICSRCPASIAPEGSGPPAGLRQEPRRPDGRPATCCGIAASTSSACSIRVRRSSSAGAAPGIARFAAPGRFTAAATASRAPRRPSPSWQQIREPGVFIVDDVAFIQAEHGMAIGEAIARPGIKKQYYLETRGDVLLRNKDVFRFWKTLGLQYMFLGVEAIDEEGLKRYPQAGERLQELRGARVRAVAGRHGRDQHHRRSRLGPRASSR